MWSVMSSTASATVATVAVFPADVVIISNHVCCWK